MSTPAAQFTGDIPRYYDRHLGPIIFEDYAADLARRAAAIGGEDMLEIAGGTGISTVALRKALPAATRIVATDLNEPMLEISKGKLAGAENITFMVFGCCRVNQYVIDEIQHSTSCHIFENQVPHHLHECSRGIGLAKR